MIARRAFLGGLLAAAASPCREAAAEENFFAGKTITYIVATKPGGGYDTMGRLVAKYLARHIPGVQIVVKNVPGAGHLVGYQAIHSAAADGLTIGTFNIGLIYSQLSGALDSTLDLAKVSWIGKAAEESRVILVAANSDVTDIAQLKNPDRVFKVAVNAKGGSAHVDTTLLAKSFGFNLKPIFGFEGTDAELSLLRGEIDVLMGSRSSFDHFVASGNGRYLVEIGGAPGSTLPQADVLAKTEAEKSVIAVIEAPAKCARVTAGPPGIPPERLELLRKAYLATLSDPDLLAEAKAQGLPIAPAPGEWVAERIKSALNPPPEITATVKEILE